MAYTINGMVTDPSEINSWFGDSVEEQPDNNPGGGQEEKETKEEKEEPLKNNPDENTITDENHLEAADLFEEEEDKGGKGSQGRVGNEDKPENEREPSEQPGGSSPAKLYSSIANSLVEEGALSHLSEEEVKEVKDAETLVAAMKKQVESMLDEKQKRISSALEAGIPDVQIKNYEGSIQYLESLTDDQISAEDADGEKIRRELIYAYQMSLDGNEDRANKMVDRAFKQGTDVEDAKEYREALKTYYQKEYQKKIDEGKAEAETRKKQQQDEIKRFKETLLTDKKILGDIEVDDKTRQLAFDNWMRPTHKTEKGTYQSTIQKYIAENPADFQMKVALLFTMTDGFKNMGNVLKQTVKKEKKKALEELETIVNSTQRTPSGVFNPRGKDPEASFNGLHFASPDSWKQ